MDRMPRYYSQATTRGYGEEMPPYWTRKRVFLVTFGISLIVGVIALAFLSPVYRSGATLLISAPVAIDQASPEADLQRVAIQRELLHSQPVLSRVLEELSTTKNYSNLALEDIEPLLTTVPVKETNLLELQAEGGDKDLLEPLVTSWVKVFLAEHQRQVEKNVATTTKSLEKELEQMAQKITASREQLQRYREQHDIVSAEREENETLSRLRGFNESLNKSMEEELKAKSHLDDVKAMVSNGESAIATSQQEYVTDLENQLNALQSRLAVLERKYTREYINLKPEMREVVQEIEVLQEELDSIHKSGNQQAINEAQQEYDKARRVTANLREAFASRKEEARKTTAIFAEHQAMVTDLEDLEALYRETLTRQAKIESQQYDNYPQVTVIADASPAKLIWPNYWLLILIVVGGSLGIAIFTVWLTSWLTKSPQQGGPVTLNGLHVYANSPEQLAGYLAGQADKLERSDTKAIGRDGETQP